MLAQPTEPNAFLASLAPREFALLRPHLAPFEMRASECLYRVGDTIEDVVFPRSGLVALTIPLRDGGGPSAALIGRDGIVGGHAAAAPAPATCDAEVYVGGHALRMSAAAFRHVLEESPVVRRLAAQFDSALLAQAQQTALCNAAHPVEARICRLLLEVENHNGNGKIPLTQATLARMLSVRRTTVTLMAGRLEAAGVLSCRRGFVQIVDPDELERRSCECYGHLKRSRDRIFAGSENGVSTGSPALRLNVRR
jgi:CRP-like cAMP-binding protein